MVKYRISAIAVVVVLLPHLACAQAPAPVEPVELDAATYPWLAEWSGELPPLAPLSSVFPAPEGFERVPAAEGSFGEWLRGLPVRLDRTTVHLHNGVPIPAPAAAVMTIQGLRRCPGGL